MDTLRAASFGRPSFALITTARGVRMALYLRVVGPAAC